MGYYSSIQGISAFIGASILVLIFIFGSVHTWQKGTLECSLVSEWGEGSTKWHKANDESYGVTFT